MTTLVSDQAAMIAATSVRQPAQAIVVSATMEGRCPRHERPWTPEEDAVLLRDGASIAAPIINRSRMACNLRAFRLRNPGYDQRYRKYVGKEANVLRNDNR